jgi:hypothetical protein
MNAGISIIWGGYLISLIGVIFKIEHWLGANILLITGFSCMAIASVWVWKQQNKVLPFWFNLATSVTLLFFILSALFSTLHWPGHSELRSIGYILCMAFPALLLLPRHLSLSREYWIIYTAWVLVVIMLSSIHPIGT